MIDRHNQSSGKIIEFGRIDRSEVACGNRPRWIFHAKLREGGGSAISIGAMLCVGSTKAGNRSFVEDAQYIANQHRLAAVRGGEAELRIS